MSFFELQCVDPNKKIEITMIAAVTNVTKKGVREEWCELSDKIMFSSSTLTLRYVIPVVCVANESECSQQHNLFRTMLYSNKWNYMFRPEMAIISFPQWLRRVYIICVRAFWWRYTPQETHGDQEDGPRDTQKTATHVSTASTYICQHNTPDMVPSPYH
jgi:hypothetical protein